MKITSPGGIFNASLEDIMNGVQTYRNPKLVHIFDKLGMIENFGTGIPRTIYSYRDYDIQPEFKITNNFFVITLPNINFYNEYTSGRINGRLNQQNDADGRINENIGRLGKEILLIIMQNPGIRIPEIVIKLSERGKIVSYSKTRNCVRRNLIDHVEHRGSKKSGGYYLKSNR